MRVFDVEISEEQLRAITRHAEREYPNEACGVILGRPTEAELAVVVPLRNVQDRYHALDPATFPRTAKEAFRIDELERMRMLDAAEQDGLTERVLYHSHCDVGAYFSEQDRAMAIHDGIELMPGIVHVVISVCDGRRQDAAAYRYVASRGEFEEVRLGPVVALAR